MGPYSMDLRRRVAEAVDNQEGSLRQLARRFCVSVTFITRLLGRRRQTGSLAPRRRTPPCPGRGRPTAPAATAPGAARCHPGGVGPAAGLWADGRLANPAPTQDHPQEEGV